MVPEVKKGPLGIFDVYVEEGIIYSNRRAGGRLPGSDEIIQRLREYQERRTEAVPGQDSSGAAGADSVCT